MSTDEGSDPTFREIVRRTMGRRCPVCARGALFRSWQRLEPHCPECGWIIDREPGSVTGSMYFVSIPSQFLAALLLILVATLTDWSPWKAILLTGPVILLFSLCSLPYMRTIWIALDYYTDLKSGETTTMDYARRAFRDVRASDADRVKADA